MPKTRLTSPTGTSLLEGDSIIGDFVRSFVDFIARHDCFVINDMQLLREVIKDQDVFHDILFELGITATMRNDDSAHLPSPLTEEEEEMSAPSPPPRKIVQVAGVSDPPGYLQSAALPLVAQQLFHTPEQLRVNLPSDGYPGRTPGSSSSGFNENTERDIVQCHAEYSQQQYWGGTTVQEDLSDVNEWLSNIMDTATHPAQHTDYFAYVISSSTEYSLAPAPQPSSGVPLPASLEKILSFEEPQALHHSSQYTRHIELATVPSRLSGHSHNTHGPVRYYPYQTRTSTTSSLLTQSPDGIQHRERRHRHEEEAPFPQWEEDEAPPEFEVYLPADVMESNAVFALEDLDIYFSS